MMTDETLPLEKPTILVVDDTPENLTMMSFLLKDRYKVKVANHGQKALRIAASSIEEHKVGWRVVQKA